LEDKLVVSDKNESSGEKEALNSERRDELFNGLQEALDSMEPEQCETIIAAFSKYSLSAEDKDRLDKITVFVEEYDFDEALALLQN